MRVIFRILKNMEHLILTICPGRTGRKGNTGTSYTLFTPGNAPKARDLVSVLTEAKQVRSRLPIKSNHLDTDRQS